MSKKYEKQVKKINLFFIIFIIFIFLHISLIYSLRLYPFIDLPNHLSEATVFRYYGDGENEFSRYYSLEIFPKPGIFHFLFCSLPIFPSVEWGNRIFYCFYIFFLPFSVLMVINKLKGNHWFTLLSFLLLYNYNVCCGLAGFSISIPFVILILYLLLDPPEKIKKKILLALLFCLIFTMHAITTLFCILMYFLIVLIRNKKCFLKFVQEITVIVPVSIITLIWWLKDSAKGGETLNFLYFYYKNEYIKTLFKRAGLFMFDNYFLYEGIKGVLIALFFSLFIIVPAIKFLKRKNLKESVNILPLNIFILSSLSCFLLLPDRIPGNWCLYERFSVLFLLSLIIFSSILCREKRSKIFVFILCVGILLHFILWTSYFIDFQQENRLFTKDLFPDNREGKKLTALIYENKFRGKPMYLHFQNYYIIWKRGIASTMITDYRFGPVRRKTDKKLLPSYLDMVLNKNKIEENLKNSDYILIKGEIPKNLKLELIKSKGVWTLCKYNGSGGNGR